MQPASDHSPVPFSDLVDPLGEAMPWPDIEVDRWPDTQMLAASDEAANAIAAQQAIASGQRVALRRAQPADAARAWRWLTQSDLTPRRLGPPLYADHPPPSFAAFCNDFAPHFFDGSLPYEGRGFIVRSLAQARDVGFISHERLDVLNDVATLDLWLADTSQVGRGYGSEAIGLLCGWLQAQRGISRFLLRPSRRNVRALRAMRRAGFRETDLPPAAVIDKLGLARGDYADEVLLFRFLPLPPQRMRPLASCCHVYVDSEFTRLSQPELLSVGAVADDGAQFYGEVAEALSPAAGPLAGRCSEFVQRVVLPLMDHRPLPRAQLAVQFTQWLAERGRHGPVRIVTDSGFDRWALAELLQQEDLPDGVDWVRVPIAYETLDDVAERLSLRRHHALDDAHALRRAVVDGE